MQLLQGYFQYWNVIITMRFVSARMQAQLLFLYIIEWIHFNAFLLIKQKKKVEFNEKPKIFRTTQNTFVSGIEMSVECLLLNVITISRWQILYLYLQFLTQY